MQVTHGVINGQVIVGAKRNGNVCAMTCKPKAARARAWLHIYVYTATVAAVDAYRGMAGACVGA